MLTGFSYFYNAIKTINVTLPLSGGEVRLLSFLFVMSVKAEKKEFY